jgi:hypothetical protein
VLALLVHVAPDCGDRFGEVFTDKVRSETRPCGKVASVNCLDPRGWHRIPTGSMQELHVLNEVRGVVCTVGTVLWIHVKPNVVESYLFHAFVDHASAVA